MPSLTAVTPLKTSTRRQKEVRNRKILADLDKLLTVPGAMASVCEKKIGKRYGLSQSAVQKIRKQALAA